MSSQRLQKVLAQAGVASRRAAEILITEGRVRVNGRIVRELGARANPDKDRVEVDGRRLVAQRNVYFLMHKPRGVVTTLDDPEGRKSIKDFLRNVNERVFPVGRLDFQTSGALLLTNDGELAQALLHPTRAVPKTYNAKLQGKLDAERLNQLRAGIVLDDGHKTAPAEVQIIRTDDKATSVEITISEGKNRQIHRMGEAIARTVLRLTRLSFAGLTIEGLRPGQMRPLTPRELTDLKEAYLHKPNRRRNGRGFDLGPFAAASAPLSGKQGPGGGKLQDSWGSEEEPSWGESEAGGDEREAPVATAAARRAPARQAQSAGARSPARGSRNERGGRTERGAQPRDDRSVRGGRTKRGAQPRNDRNARTTQDTKTTRSRPTKTKRVQTPRTKKPFKR
jgi:23S rRNA pseudouridine2605 synthase